MKKYTSHRLNDKWNCSIKRINRIDHWCSVGTGKSQPEAPPLQWETRLALFPTGTVDPRVGIFLSQLNTNDQFFFSFSHIPSPNCFTYDSSLYFNMQVSDERNKNISTVEQFWYQNVPFDLTKKTHTLT